MVVSSPIWLREIGKGIEDPGVRSKKPEFRMLNREYSILKFFLYFKFL
jgi:hypothetical protein